jgi:hypothetical protein
LATGVAVAVLVDVMAAHASGHRKNAVCRTIAATTRPTMVIQVSVMTPH